MCRQYPEGPAREGVADMENRGKSFRAGSFLVLSFLAVLAAVGVPEADALHNYYMGGAKACDICHNPHSSTQAKLLRVIQVSPFTLVESSAKTFEPIGFTAASSGASRSGCHTLARA